MQTTGFAFGATNTKSKSLSSAFFKASSKETNPIFSPSAPINWTSLALICLLIGNSCFMLKHLHK